MYSNTKHLKDHEIKARFDEETYQAIDALAKFHRTQRAVFVRELVEAALARMIENDGIEESNVA